MSGPLCPLFHPPNQPILHERDARDVSLFHARHKGCWGHLSHGVPPRGLRVAHKRVSRCTNKLAASFAMSCLANSSCIVSGSPSIHTTGARQGASRHTAGIAFTMKKRGGRSPGASGVVVCSARDLLDFLPEQTIPTILEGLTLYQMPPRIWSRAYVRKSVFSLNRILGWCYGNQPFAILLAPSTAGFPSSELRSLYHRVPAAAREGARVAGGVREWQALLHRLLSSTLGGTGKIFHTLLSLAHNTSLQLSSLHRTQCTTLTAAAHPAIDYSGPPYALRRA